MKKAILSLAITAASVFGAQTVVAQTEVNATSKAVISVDKDVHDYGTIEQGANGECVFTVTNTGTEPLIISLCKGSCGCTVPVCPQEPIAPGTSAKITVKYNTANPGPINKSVTITSNASNEPSKTVRISGNVTAKPTGGAPVNTGGPTNQ
jgi:uncharacterized low-complexity protein